MFDTSENALCKFTAVTVTLRVIFYEQYKNL